MRTKTTELGTSLVAAWNHLATTWVLLSLPAVAILGAAFQGAESGMLLHISGEVSARLLIVTLAVTPLRMLFKSHRWPRWLGARRRALGVASFIYAALHLGFYAWFEGLLTDWAAPAIATGWIATAVMLPLAITSTDGWVRRLGRRWKTLQRGAYLVALFTAAHWLLLDGGLGPMLVHFAPLAGLETTRLIRLLRRSRARPAQPADSPPGPPSDRP